MTLLDQQKAIADLQIQVTTGRNFCLAIIDIEQTNKLFTTNPFLLNKWLSQAEQEKLDQLKLPKRYQEWLSGRIAIKLALRQHIKNNFTPAQYSVFTHNHGEPYIDPPINNLQVSISHSWQFCAGLVATQDCGVDIQKIEEKICRLKHKFASEREIKIIKEHIKSEKELLTLIWTVKETIKKQWLAASPSLFQDTTVTRLHGNKGQWTTECTVVINEYSPQTVKQQVSVTLFNGYMLAWANKT